MTWEESCLKVEGFKFAFSFQVYCTSKSVAVHHQSFGDPLADIKHHVCSTYRCGALMMLYQSEGLNRTYCCCPNSSCLIHLLDHLLACTYYLIYDWFDRGAKPSHLYLRKLRSWVVRSLRLIISHHLQRSVSAGPQVCIFPKRTQRGCGITVSSLDLIQRFGWNDELHRTVCFHFVSLHLAYKYNQVDKRSSWYQTQTRFVIVTICHCIIIAFECFKSGAVPNSSLAWFDHPLSCQCI